MAEQKKDAVELISTLVIKVEQLLQQTDQTLQTLQQNLNKVSTQKIKLIAQKELLLDLKNVLTQPVEETKAVEALEPVDAVSINQSKKKK